MIKAVLFDFDGTLMNTNESVCYGYKCVFNKYRPDFELTDEFLHSLLGPSLIQVFPKYFKEDFDTLVKVYRQGAHSLFDKEHVYPFNNAISTIKKLKEKGIKVAIISSRVQFSLKQVADIHNMTELFDLIIGCDDVSKHKPDPEGILLALNKLNINNNEAIMVGDHGGDMKAAKAANVKGIGVSYSYYGNDNLIKDGAYKIIDDLSEILDLVEEL